MVCEDDGCGVRGRWPQCVWGAHSAVIQGPAVCQGNPGEEAGCPAVTLWVLVTCVCVTEI